MVVKRVIEKIKKKVRKPVYDKDAPNPYSIKTGAEAIKDRKKGYDRMMDEINSDMREIDRKRKKKGM